MASDPRDIAKRSIVVKDDEDSELESAFSQGRDLSLEILKENNRHSADMLHKELGAFGRIIGGEATAPTVSALIVVGFGSVAAVGCWVAAAHLPDQAEFWAKQAERCLGLGSAALAFIFGKGSK